MNEQPAMFAKSLVEQHRVAVSDRFWMSEREAIEPLSYHRIRFESKARGPGYVFIVFFDAEGALLPDFSDAVYASDGWLAHDYCFRAPIDARTAAVRLEPQRDDLRARRVSVVPVQRREVAAWADSVAEHLPPIGFDPPSDRLRSLTATRQKLREGGVLRVVILGDSIANDLSNSAIDVLIEDAYPGSRVELVNSVRGATGCWFYRKAGNVERYILRYKPDLLVIAGISHHYDADSIRGVVEQVRASSNAEILVLTGALAVDREMREAFIAQTKMPRDKAIARVAAFTSRLRALTASHGVAFFDLCSVWEAYLADCGQPRAWFLRDVVHANQRGRQAMARMVLRRLRNDHE